MNSIWELDVGKLIVPRVFMDMDLLTQTANNYDPNTQTIKNVNGGSLIEINDDEFRNVFRLSEVSNYLESINFETLGQVYNAQRDHLKNGHLKEFFAKIGGLTIVGPSTMELFSLNLFTLRDKGMYWSLCQIFREDTETTMSTHYMLMIAKILKPSLVVTFDFAPYLTNAIHEGLIGIKSAKVERSLRWYSLLMHMFLFKGAEYFLMKWT